MIFRRVSSPNESERQPGLRPIWQAFLDTQKSIDPPYGIVLQAEHARLAGELAAKLQPAAFGSLPPEVLDAIGQHDAGWKSGDEAQLASIAETPPKPFPLLPTQQAIPYWNESIRKAEQLSRLTGVIVSRHFCALATQDPAHQRFLEEEAPRRESVEKNLAIAREDLDRWTGAIGFCDILSLYLCSGTTEPVELPLAHPALPDARDARKVFLEWVNGKPRFSSSLMNPGATVSVTTMERSDSAPNLKPQTISWNFAV